MLCTDGPSEIDDDGLAPARAQRHRASARSASPRSKGRDGILRAHRLRRPASRCRAARCSSRPASRSSSELAIRLGCEFNEKGTVRTGKYETTHLPGLFVAGDASRAVQWVIVAAAEGAEAAFAINTDLIKEDLAE